MTNSSSSLPQKKPKNGAKKVGKKTEKKTGKKTGKKTTGKKKPTSSDTAFHLATPPPMASPYGYEPAYAHVAHQNHGFEKSGNRKGKGTAAAVVCLTVVFYLVAIVLGLIVMTSCVWTKASANNIFLAEISTNATSDVSLRIGYFGGCVSITEAAEITSDGNSSTHTYTSCVTNMHRSDLNELSEDLWEPLKLNSSAALSDVQSFLNTTIPQAKHLQDNVFFYQPPLIHVLLFFISGIMLLVARTGASQRKSYKATIVISAALSAFALALALVTALGSLQGLNALLNSSVSGDEMDLGDSFYISRGKRLEELQWALVGVVTVFYLLMGTLFVQRASEGGVQMIFQAFQYAGAPLKKRMWGRR
ncbi:unnamed protein product [Penicillium glandicola]